MKSGWAAVVVAIALSVGISIGTARRVHAQSDQSAQSAGALGQSTNEAVIDDPPDLLLSVLPGSFANSSRFAPGADLSGLRHWDAYSGVVLVSEADFYRIVGEGALAHAVDAARKRRFVGIGVGTAAMLLGSVLFTSAPPSGPVRPVISAKHLIGGFMIPIGGLTVGLSFMTANRRRVPLGMARELAEDYNLRLRPTHAGRY